MGLQFRKSKKLGSTKFTIGRSSGSFSVGSNGIRKTFNTNGIAKATMSSYMKGEFEPKQKNLHLISKSLKVNPSWLMGFDVPMEIENSKELKSVDDLDFSGINRIAAHFEGDEFSEDDLNEIQNFINYVKQKNKNKEK